MWYFEIRKTIEDHLKEKGYLEGMEDIFGILHVLLLKKKQDEKRVKKDEETGGTEEGL